MRNFIYIICELNPPHKGHAYLFAEAARLCAADGGVVTVAVMSGHMTQRGSPAIVDKYARARAAVSLGADLVVELPFPFSCASAENFARGGIAAARAVADAYTECTHTLAFGSECGDTAALCRAAENMSSEQFRARLYDAPDGGHNARRIAELYSEMFGALPDGPNDSLAIEYIRASSGTGIAPLAVKRIGARHDGGAEDGVASSSAIRGMMAAGRGCSGYIPDDAYEIIASAAREHGIASEARLGAAIMPILRVTDPDDADSFAECGGGVGRRILAAASEAGSYEDAIRLAATKKYTNARLRRAALFAALRVPQSAFGDAVEGVRLLAASAVGTEVLRGMRGRVRVAVRAADAFGVDGGIYDRRADALYAMAYEPALPAGEFARRAPWIG